MGLRSKLSKAFAKVRPVAQIAARAVAAYYTSGASEQLLNSYNQVKGNMELAGDDLVSETMNKYPQVATLVQGYRGYEQTRKQRAVAPQLSEYVDEGDYDEDEDFYDDEEQYDDEEY